ncbi:MAG TPA: zinc-binding dehydrogenase [Candidatus Acidoferrum sp.]|nr:zinc-binding dehydrogenase [Candidatus Acidoferrum sp.]
MEAYLARTARNLSIPASGRDAKNPFAPTAEVLSEARVHFADHCAICHGNDGIGKTQIGQNLYPKAPAMRLPPTQNLTDGEIYYVIHDGVRLTVEVERPTPGVKEILIEVRAAGINYAEIELISGKYQVPKQPPFVMGFEASGIVTEVGSQVRNHRVGDRVTSIVSSGGYADYAVADAGFAIPIPEGISFAQAATIPIQGLSAYALLKFAAMPRATESVLLQSAAGGVGLYLVQLLKIMGVKRVIALASSKEKLELVKSLGADLTFNYSEPDWADRVRAATDGSGVDVVLEAASEEVGEASFKLIAPFGRMIVFGAKNIHDTISSEKVRQLIYGNQSLTGFNFPSLRPQQIAECAPNLLDLISHQKIKLFANTSFPLANVRTAFEALASRRTIGKVVLTTYQENQTIGTSFRGDEL